MLLALIECKTRRPIADVERRKENLIVNYFVLCIRMAAHTSNPLKVYVGNLPYKWTRKELGDFGRMVGTVEVRTTVCFVELLLLHRSFVCTMCMLDALSDHQPLLSCLTIPSSLRAFAINHS